MYKFSVALWAICLAAGAASGEDFIGDRETSTHTPSVHRIDLLDEEGSKVDPADEPSLPFSLRNTCGACHDVGKVSGGWHFNFNDGAAEAGRRGEPWLFVDAETGTQLPVSYRKWAGVYRPEQAGLRPWGFMKEFGRQMPGNLSDADEDEPDFDARWLVSGGMEINCLGCHDSNPAYDAAEYGFQLGKENLRWAPAGASCLAKVTGNASDMDEMYDYLIDPPPDDTKLIPPGVAYHKEYFGTDGKVFMDVGREIDNGRCYFCHSYREADEGDEWQMGEDVHVAAGLSCVDCHHNGLGHAIVRGYEGEEGNDNADGSYTCRGCHLETGEFGAPRPLHKGFPPLHFEKLSCTACHSGPMPRGEVFVVQTSRGHGLGNHGPARTKEMLPHIYGGLFGRGYDGKITPMRGVYPTFWGRLKDNKVEPLDLAVVKKKVGGIIGNAGSILSGLAGLDERKVKECLEALGGAGIDGEAVLVSGGMVYQLNGAGWAGYFYNEAKLCMWPVAHNVRPAGQALGAESCRDCHDKDSSFFFAAVPGDGPDMPMKPALRMVDLLELDEGYMRFFGFSFVFRPMLKVVLAVVAAGAGVLLLTYVMRMLLFVLGRVDDYGAIVKVLGGLIMLGAVVSFGAAAVTGLWPLLKGVSASGYTLAVHVSAGPVFVVCVFLLALLKADKQRLSERAGVIGKLCFWVTLAMLLPLIGSVLFSMVPVLASEAQDWLLMIHVISGIVVCVSFLGMCGRLVRITAGKRHET